MTTLKGGKKQNFISFLCFFLFFFLKRIATVSNSICLFPADKTKQTSSLSSKERLDPNSIFLPKHPDTTWEELHELLHRSSCPQTNATLPPRSKASLRFEEGKRLISKWFFTSHIKHNMWMAQAKRQLPATQQNVAIKGSHQLTAHEVKASLTAWLLGTSLSTH